MWLNQLAVQLGMHFPLIARETTLSHSGDIVSSLKINLGKLHVEIPCSYYFLRFDPFGVIHL